MPQSGRRRSALLLVGLMIVLAGCSAVPGMGPSISDPQSDIVNGQPAIVFDYSVGDYSDILLTGPDGNVVNRGTLEPDDETAALWMPAHRSGTYTLIIQQGGETVLEKEVEFEGGQPEISIVNSSWDGNQIQSVAYRVENRGDLPVRTTNATLGLQSEKYSARGASDWVSPGENVTVTATPLYGTPEISQTGTVQGELILNTTQGELVRGFSHTIAPPELDVQSVEPAWNNGRLESVSYTIQNTGDIESSATADLIVGGSSVKQTEHRIASNSSEEVTIETSPFSDSLYTVSSGGTVTVEVALSSDSQSVSESVSRDFEEPEASLSDVDASSYEIFDSNDEQLSSMSFTVENTGSIQLVYDTITIEIDGVSRTETRSITAELAPGETQPITEYFDSIRLNTGSYEMTIQLKNGDQVVHEETATVSIG